MASGTFQHNSVGLSGVDLKRYLKKDVSGYVKSIQNATSTLSSTTKSVGISKSDATLSLDKILAAETCEVLNRAANEIAGYSGEVDAETMDMVVEIFVNRVLGLLQKITDLEPNDNFACTSCWELLYDPITLSCGHTFCKNCVKKLTECKECKTKIDQGKLPSSSILLTTILQKYYSMDYVMRCVTLEADALMERKDYQEAALKYMDATEFGLKSRAATLGRAKAFSELGNTECAVQDAFNVPTFAKSSLQAQLTKGEILLKNNEEGAALMCFLSCLAMDSDNEKASTYTRKILEKFISKYFSDETSASKKRKRDDDAENQNCSSSCHSQPRQGGPLMDTIICCLFRDIDQSLLSDVNLETYLNTDGKDRKDALCVGRTFDDSSVDSSDFECSLCMMLFFNPVSTTCGHTFCRDCLERSMDHGDGCPLCKRTMSLNVSDQKRSSPSLDMTLASIIRQIMPDDYKERLEYHEQEVKNIRSWTPVFVCTLAFPYMPCPLHVFEPRYRLLLRRAMDIHDKKFGITMPADDKPFHEVGTIVQIKNVSFFPDGRSVVESEGCRRFKAVECGVKDGYSTAKVEYIVDDVVTKPEDKIVLERLSILVYNGAKTWFDGIRDEQKERIRQHFGDFPLKDEALGADGPKWAWWLLAVLPVEDKVKRSVLGKTLLRDRLLTMHKILNLLRKTRQS